MGAMTGEQTVGAAKQTSDVGIVCSQEQPMMAQAPKLATVRPARSPHTPLKPEVKAWLDNVLIPALVEEWKKQSAARMAA